MERHHIKFSFALILIVGGLWQLTLGGSFLVKTQDKPAYFKQSGIQQRDYSASAGDYSALSIPKDSTTNQNKTCYIDATKFIDDPCGFSFYGYPCRLSDCSKLLGKEYEEKCIKKCEDTFRAFNVTSVNIFPDSLKAGSSK